MDYSTWAFLLLALAVCLLIAEVFIPTGGLIGVMATLTIVSALVCAWMAWWDSNQGAFWSFLGGMTLLIPATVVTAFYFWPNTPIGRRAILQEPEPHEISAFVELEEKHKQLVGKVGETVTLLNPGGMARFDGQRVHCQSEGMILEAGLPVIVIAARPNSVVVRRFDPQSASAAAPSSPRAPARGNEPLDFDVR